MAISGGGLMIFTVKSASRFGAFIQSITFGVGTFARSRWASCLSRTPF